MTETTEDGQVGHFEKEMIEELERLSQLSEENEKLEAQVSSLTEEIDELKSKIDPNQYYPTKCNDCGWEGSSKFARVFYYHDDCDVACPCCHSNDLVDLEKEISDEHSIQNLTIFIDKQEFELTEKISDLQTKLSNREKEIVRLKEDKKSILQLFNDPDYFYDPNDTDSNECIQIEDFDEKLKDYDEGEVLKLIPVHELLPRYFVVGDHDQYFKTEQEALAALNKSKEGEEE